ncbi:TPA: DNA polymerase II large subunit [archaeon]|nr:DNA polymerase II large subunit [Candidatus Naiadarchaeales archaeon SRR2090153.bin1042]
MNTREYQEQIEKRVFQEFEIAKQARSRGFDYALVPEIYIAKDIADKVEGLIELKGIADIIRQLQKQYKTDEEVAFKLADYIISKNLSETSDRETASELAIRAGLAYLTQGAVSAPIEGIAKVRIKKNPDGTEYLSVYYSGPIRAAGGTAEALSIIVADYVRKSLGLGKYKPTLQEIGRYGEEILWYKRNVHLQYMPTQEEIETIVRNVPVCIDGEPTEEFEVITYRDLGRVETNRVRGGMCLVVAEGIAQKAPKLVKKLKPLEEKYGLDWRWLEGLLVKRVAKEVPYAHERLEAIIESAPTEEYPWLQEIEIEDVSALGKFVDVTKEAGEFIDEITEEPASEIEGSDKYMQEIPAGRPVFSHPSRRGGFNLRYGRTRATGYSAVAVNPATMYVLGEFIAIGTQLRLELPGKAGIVTPCETINGPTVVLDDGEVLQINTVEEAEKHRKTIKKILNLGDILISAGDFIENNHKLLPSTYCEEWWAQEVKKAASERKIKDARIAEYTEKPYPAPSFEKAVEISRTYNIPMHPKYTFFWHDITKSQLERLVNYLSEKNFSEKNELTYSKDLKEILEALCVFHGVNGKKVILSPNNTKALLYSLSLNERGAEKILSIIKEKNSSKDVVEILNKIAPFKIKKRTPTYIGARMGRPEKAKPRKMVPPPNVLFPTGITKGRIRDLIKAATAVVTQKTEIAIFKCDNCNSKTIFPYCQNCSSRTKLINFCPNCRRETTKDKCPSCGIETKSFDRREINLKELVDMAFKNINEKNLNKLVGVIGMTSKYKIPEPIEKGILRAKNHVCVFKDGTVRFDATNAPLSHFKPIEIGVSVEKLKVLGYSSDIDGKKLTDENQILELKPQDILISDYGDESGTSYLVSATKFIDDLLEKFYKYPRFYNVKRKEELLGHLVVALAPHTSTGIIGRIIGFTKAKVCFANPAFHDAKRRDCDGDEDSVMLLLDAFLNFSKSFIPDKRGGRMDAPLVITTTLNPLEIDREVYDVDIVSQYPLEFYELTEQKSDPAKVQIKTFGDIVNTSDPFNGWLYTHDVIDINNAPLSNIYTEGEMLDKLKKQLDLAEKIRAVDASDVAARIINTHFIPDIKGNLRTFSRQKIRCTKCNSKCRRPPLSGVCTKCGGNLTLTVHPGTIKKYLNISKEMVEKYKTSDYLKQQIELLDKSITSIFGKEKQQKLVKW